MGEQLAAVGEKGIAVLIIVAVGQQIKAMVRHKQRPLSIISLFG